MRTTLKPTLASARNSAWTSRSTDARTAFLEYYCHPDPEYKEVVEKLSKYVYGPDLTPVHCMSPTRALQMLWGYYAGSIPKGPNAEEDGFQSATPIRRLTAELLKAAFPYKGKFIVSNNQTGPCSKYITCLSQREKQ